MESLYCAAPVGTFVSPEAWRRTGERKNAEARRTLRTNGVGRRLETGGGPSSQAVDPLRKWRCKGPEKSFSCARVRPDGLRPSPFFSRVVSAPSASQRFFSLASAADIHAIFVVGNGRPPRPVQSNFPVDETSIPSEMLSPKTRQLVPRKSILTSISPQQLFFFARAPRLFRLPQKRAFGDICANKRQPKHNQRFAAP